MALKPTIFKMAINVADLNRDYYQAHQLVLAQHPSESPERMMARVLAYCLNAQDQLTFTRGLCAVEEPEIWARTLDNQISLWIDVGEPAADRIKKATRLARNVKVYSFNSKASVWWLQEQAKFRDVAATVVQFHWESVKTLAAMLQRTMNISVTISGDTAYFSTENGECEVAWVQLQ